MGLREWGTQRFAGFSQEIRQGLKLISLARRERAKPEGLAYLEADRAFARAVKAAYGMGRGCGARDVCRGRRGSILYVGLRLYFRCTAAMCCGRRRLCLVTSES